MVDNVINKSCIVVDIGSGITKAGFAGYLFYHFGCAETGAEPLNTKFVFNTQGAVYIF